MALINDDRLGLDTRGFAAWLLARPDGWEIRSSALPRLLSSRVEHVGREKTRRFLRELEAAAYLTRARWRDTHGRWIWNYCFRPTPSPETPSTTIDGFAGDGSAVGGSAVDGKPVAILHTPISSRSDQSISNATTTAAPDKLAVVGGLLEVRFPQCLTGSQLASARKLISRCPQADAQAVLDELSAMIAQGAVRYPMGLLKRLVDRAIVGEFSPNRSLARSTLRAPSTENDSLESTIGGRTERTTQPQVASKVAQRVLSQLQSKSDPESM
ncbi:MAG TPA: hypothetical protein VIY90_20360 [Steroidobacteraceae bacterium]